MARHSSHRPHGGKTWAASTTTSTPLSNKSLSKLLSRPKALSKTIAFFRQHFWTISSANHFSDDSLPPAKPITTGAYVPRHAASDFSKNASRSKRRQGMLNPRVGVIDNRHSLIFEYDDDDSTLCSINNDRRRGNNRRSRVINGTLSSGSPTPPSSDEFNAFLAQAETNDRLRRRSALIEVERSSPNPHQRSTYLVASTGGYDRRTSFLTQQIAEYIRPVTAG